MTPLHSGPDQRPRAWQRVVVIEDSAEDALLLELAFQEVAPEVQFIMLDNEHEALRVLQTPPTPDLVLLDLHLPGWRGVDLLSALRAQGGADLRVVCWSSRASPAEVEATYAQGVVACVDKPLGHDDLLRLVQTWLTL